MIPSARFVALDRSVHDRKLFNCGAEALNTFLWQYAVRHQKAGISKTMVLSARENAGAICAYYTLSHTGIGRESLPPARAKKLPRYPVPVMLIAQLAVHQTV